MKPIEARLRGFRSFREDRPACVSFEGISAVAIIGDTGAGKSSILEAMTLGPLRRDLEGRTSAPAPDANDHADHLEASLVFEAGGKTYHVRRSARKTRAGQVESDGAVLTEADAKRRPAAILAEQVAPVTRAIEAIVGLDADAFQRTTILPQGRFSRLLAEDDQKVRAAVLRQIWSTDEVDQAHLRVAGAARQAAELLALAVHERGNHPPDPAAHAAALAKATDTARVELQAADRRRDAAGRAVDARENERRTTAATNDATRRIRTAAQEWQDAARETETVETTRHTLTRAAAVTAEARDLRQAAVDEDESRLGSVASRILGAGALRELARTATHAADASEGAAAAEREAAEARRTADEVRGARPQLRDTLAGARTETESAETEARAGLTASIESASTAEHAGPTLASLRERLLNDRPRAAASNAGRAVLRAAETAATAEQALRTAEAAERSTTAEAAEARHLSAAAAAAHGHKPGAPCPVCDRALPTAWRAPKGGNLQAALAAETEARSTTAVARTATAEAHRALSAAEGHAATARSAAATAEDRIADDALKAGETAGAETTRWPDGADGGSPSRPPGAGDRRRRETGAVLSGTNARSG